MSSFHDRHAGTTIGCRSGARFELFLIRLAEPAIEELLAKRPQAVVPWRVAELRKRGGDPVRTLPFGINLIHRSDPTIRLPALQQSAHQLRVADLIPEHVHLRAVLRFQEHGNTGPIADSGVFGGEQRIEDSLNALRS